MLRFSQFWLYSLFPHRIVPWALSNFFLNYCCFHRDTQREPAGASGSVWGGEREREYSANKTQHCSVPPWGWWGGGGEEPVWFVLCEVTQQVICKTLKKKRHCLSENWQLYSSLQNGSCFFSLFNSIVTNHWQLTSSSWKRIQLSTTLSALSGRYLTRNF